MSGSLVSATCVHCKCIRVYTRMYVCTYYIHINVHTYRHTDIHAYHTGIHTHVHTYIHTYTQHASLWENVASVTATIIIVQTNIHHRSKVFTTGQARVNPECCVIKCVGG